MPDSAAALAPPDVTPHLLQEITDRIVEQLSPQKVVLFGSHAWGSPGSGSDVDLLVIMESDERPARRAARVSRVCRPRLLPMDIIVKTPDEVQERLDVGDPFLRRILREGKVLYER